MSSHQSGTTSIATMWQHAGVSSDMCGAGPCLWESVEPTLQLRDNTNARLELSLPKMADGVPQEWPHQHYLWRSWHWPTEEPHANTPFWVHKCITQISSVPWLISSTHHCKVNINLWIINMNINYDINDNGRIYSTADGYMDWDISKPEGVEGWVMFAVTDSPPLLLLNHMLLCMRHYSY